MGRKERERRKKEDQWGWGGMGYRCLKFHPSCHFLDIRLTMGKLFICRGLDFLTHEVGISALQGSYEGGMVSPTTCLKQSFQVTSSQQPSSLPRIETSV